MMVCNPPRLNCRSFPFSIVFECFAEQSSKLWTHKIYFPMSPAYMNETRNFLSMGRTYYLMYASIALSRAFAIG